MVWIDAAILIRLFAADSVDDPADDPSTELVVDPLVDPAAESTEFDEAGVAAGTSMFFL